MDIFTRLAPESQVRKTFSFSLKSKYCLQVRSAAIYNIKIKNSLLQSKEYSYIKNNYLKYKLKNIFKNPIRDLTMLFLGLR